jgi:hypothetical protein
MEISYIVCTLERAESNASHVGLVGFQNRRLDVPKEVDSRVASIIYSRALSFFESTTSIIYIHVGTSKIWINILKFYSPIYMSLASLTLSLTFLSYSDPIKQPSFYPALLAAKEITSLVPETTSG